MTVTKGPKRIINRTHEHYARWYGMCKRCHDPTSRYFHNYGGLGIRVDSIWNPDNPNGLANFNAWLDEQIKANPDLKKPRVTRRDKKGNFNPGNCFVASSAEIQQNKVGVVLSAELVAKMRRYKKDNPEVSTPSVAKAFNVPTRHIYLALSGTNWASVDSIEAPLSAKLMGEGVSVRLLPGVVNNGGIGA